MVCRLFLICAICLAIGSCGGGSNSDDPGGQSNAIFVNAGADRSVTEQTLVSLTGEAQSADANLTYTWSASPLLTITHSDTSVSTATFTAPVVTQDTEYTLTLVVTGAAGGRGQDSQVITVVPNNLAPVAIITPPNFSNAESGFLPAGAQITLSGVQSTDPDASDPNRQIHDWLWQQTAGDNLLAGSETNQPSLRFTAPELDMRSAITIRLTVTDEEGTTDSEDLILTVLAANETPPLVEAGLDQYVFSGEIILLAGQASSSVSTAAPLSIEWSSDASTSINASGQVDTFAITPLVETATDIIMTLSAVDSFGNAVSDAINVNVRPAPIPLLNDTGVLLQGNENSVIDAQINDYPGQDGQKGQDRIDRSGLLEKAGRGRVGFDFTPLNANGDEMDDLADPWRCVRDNTTGLIWEVKTDDGLLHDQDATYSWFFSQNNGGFAGVENATGTTCSLAMCNTQAYVSAVNQAGLCGFFDWRMPDHDELMSIIDFGAIPGPKIDTEYFPNSGSVVTGANWYWTNQPGADGVAQDSAQNAWALDFSTGVDNFLNKSSASRVRLVRAGR